MSFTDSVRTERRSRWLLILLLVAQLILLSAQVPAAGGERTRLEAAMVAVVAPFAHLVSASAGLLGSASEGLALRGRLIAENRRLAAEVESLRRERARNFGLETDLGHLTEAMSYERPPRGALRVADIVYVDHASWLQTLLLYVGSAPIERDQPVVSGDGLVGRVVLVTGPYAKVQLVTDRAASVGAMVERTRRQGVVRGAGGGALEMDFVPLQADVREGDQVVTAGIDGIYARGVPVGTVIEVSPGNELFHRIRVRPAVDLGRLDQVWVIEREAVPEEVKEALPDARP